MSNIDYYLDRKYNVLQQQADAGTKDANTRTLDAETRAREAAAQTAEAKARAGLLEIQGNSITNNASLASIAAPIDNAAKQAQTDLTKEQTKTAVIGNTAGDPSYLKLLGAYKGITIPDSKLQSMIDGLPASSPLGGLGTSLGTKLGTTITSLPASTMSAADLAKQRAGVDALNAGRLPGFGFSGGTAKVPGKGSGKVDTVPAMLAPGEAVLNKEAAERLGRGTIDVLNAVGLHERGQVGSDAETGGGQPAPVLHAARGTSKVGGARQGSAKPMPPGINPGVLNAIMGG